MLSAVLLVAILPWPAQKPVVGATTISKNGKVEMVYVPAGKFTMGTYLFGRLAKPVRKVYLDSYWIGKNDVTVAQFRAFCLATDYKFDWTNMPYGSRWLNYPMDNVTWFDARAFCKWAGGDLPTEAQWEKAARGTDGRNYPWGNKWDSTKLCASVEGLHVASRGCGEPVGSFPSGRSPYGCLDMAGNDPQWCLDWYGPYDPRATRNPTGPKSGAGRVVRGSGYWDTDRASALCAERVQDDPSDRTGSCTIRLCMPSQGSR
ncbi:MAG: formylglycine-generating enzyme family protein [Fimbriimonadales bacterium]